MLALLACGGRPVQPASPGFSCFHWVHGPQFSTDCYESAAQCEQTRAEMSRDSTPCEPAEHASCTRLARSGEQRCFGDPGACERYRSYIAGNGLDSSACIER
jgi:hypothetical protein